ncbi:hypothetical protein LCGC14_0181640 [marine sediment metagenome]|uniref:Uncharacterized protein n=1 Tax=marine sediment metagenome TaxID=412755 RepID=A0A0F9UPM6_9ZZZZ|nr:hypothetical protein [Phycisphaerae bacterium]HDZ42523.1 hypothetical protein [Phycisphaerae bacterium]
MQCKVRIQMGPVQVEYEGPETFLKKDLAELLVKVANLTAEMGVLVSPDDPDADDNALGKGPIKGTTGTIAGKLNCKKGPELVIAAAAHLTFVAGKKSFSRSDLLNKMKTATHYYKQTHSGNLSKMLGTLVGSQKLLETSKDEYALSDEEKNSLEKALGK